MIGRTILGYNLQWINVLAIPVEAGIKVNLEEHKHESLIGPPNHWSQVSLLWRVNGGHDRGLTTWLWLHSWETTPITCRRGPGGEVVKVSILAWGKDFLNASWQAQRQHDYSLTVYTLLKGFSILLLTNDVSLRHKQLFIKYWTLGMMVISFGLQAPAVYTLSAYSAQLNYTPVVP